VRACVAAVCSAWSAVRYLEVGRVPADQNGDGYSEVLVGRLPFSSDPWTISIFEGGDPPSTVSTGGFQGGAAAFAGDVNADGFGDFVTGYPVGAGGATVRTVHGVYVTLLGTGEGERMGSSVAGAGDVNGDGFSDVLVASGTGRVHLLLGGRPMDAVVDRTFQMEPDGGAFGWSLGANVEFNGDNYADILIGDYRWGWRTGAERGKAYVFLGGASPDSTADWSVVGDPAEPGLGGSLDGLGDVDGDGDGDLIVGIGVGQVAWLFGGGPAFDDLPDLVVAWPGDDGPGIESAAGDFNGDDVADWAIATPYSARSCTTCGGLMIYFGGSPLDGAADVEFDGSVVDGRAGSCVSPAGDVNGDGWADVLLGAPGPDSWFIWIPVGAAYLLYGGSSPDGLADVTYVGADNTERFGAVVAGGWW
jgi:hypothetical protein